MVCRICKEPFYHETQTDPAEPCWCGEGAVYSPWAWDGWRGVVNAWRFRVGRWASAVATALTPETYWR